MKICASARVIEMFDEVIQFMKYRFKITLILPNHLSLWKNSRIMA